MSDISLPCPTYWLAAPPQVVVEFRLNGQPYRTWRCQVCSVWHTQRQRPLRPLCLRQYPLTEAAQTTGALLLLFPASTIKIEGQSQDDRHNA